MINETDETFVFSVDVRSSRTVVAGKLLAAFELDKVHLQIGE